MFDSESSMPVAAIATALPSPSTSIASVSDMASPPHPTNSTSIIFPIPNMTHSLHIKLYKVNFMAWRTQILAYIKRQDAYNFLNGSSQPPAQHILNSSIVAGTLATIINPNFLAWCQQDQMILSIIISTLTEPYVIHAVNSATASTLWTTLISMFASQAKARVMQIYFQLVVVQNGNNSITEYFQTIKNLCDTLAAAGQPINEFEVVSFLHKGLGTEFDPFVTSVTT